MVFLIREKKAPVNCFRFCPPRKDCFLTACQAVAWLALASLCGSLQASGGNADYLTESWRDHEGIPEGSVTALAQTPDGYLWVGSPDGLLRFNGINFYRAAAFTQLERLHGVITFLKTDHSGRMWVCGEGRLACYDAGSWRSFEGTNLNVRSVAQSITGQVLIGGGEGQLYTIVGRAVASLPPPEGVTKTNGVFCVADARDGQFWVANKGFIGRLTAKGWVRFGPAGVAPPLLLAAPGQTGGLWVYSPNALCRYDADGTRTSFPAPNLGQAREMIEDRTGTIWIATIAGGLFHFRPGGEVSVINVTNGLFHNAIRCVIEDREGNIWAGGSLNGLNRFKPQQFFNFGRAEGLPNNSVQAIAETSSGEILVGTHGGGIASIRHGKVETEPGAADDLGQFVWSLLPDRKSRLWIGTFNDGLFAQVNGIRRSFPTPAALGTTINQLMEDARGRIWVGGSAGLGVIENDAMTTCFTNSVFAGAAITALAEDAKSGKIWIGTHTQGVFEMNSQDLSRATPVPKLSGNRITSLSVDDEGYLWIGLFEHGLACFHDGKTTFIGPAQGLSADTIGSILDDGCGCFWLGTTHGILRVARSELRRVAQASSAAPPAAFNLFNVSDGLASDSCAEGSQPTALRDHAGHLWFSTDRGVVTVDPSRLRLNTNPPPPVVVEQVTFNDHAGIDHVQLNPRGPLVIPPGSTELEFDFDALSLTAPEKVVLKYQLVGVQNDWVSLGNHRELHLREPARGRYVLRVTAANNDGVWNETGTTLAFTIQPFFWQTVWFRLLALLAVAGGGGWVVRRLTRRQFQRRIDQLQRERSLEQERARERQRAEAELQRREKHFRSLIEHSSDSITVINLDGLITYQSSSGERILGHPAEAILGRNLFELIHPEDLSKTRAALVLAAAQPGRPSKVIARLRHRDGSWRTVETVGTCIQTPAGEQHCVFNARDLTDNLLLEEQLRQAQKMEAIGQLAGGVAHDFNNILSSLLLQTELLSMTASLPAKVQEGLRHISADTRRAANLTRQLLLFSRRQVMQSRQLDLNEVVMNLARMLQRIIREDVRLQLHPHSTPLMTFADAGMVEQVLMNLAVNARDAMPKGGDLLIETTETTVDPSEARLNPEAAPGRYVCLSVTDTGSGIAPEILPRIFEPFFTTKEPGKGTGLGLATVFGIVKQHHGWIKLENHPGRGATFRIYLPASAGTAAPAAAAAAKPKSNGGTETILLVEDELAVRTSTRQILERHGYQVLEAAEGAEALEVWQKHRTSVALLLTDLVMPGELGGRELGRRLRAERPGLKVIFVSGYSADIAGRDFQLQSGEAFVQKPFDAEQILETIRRCLDESRQGAPAA